MPRQTIEIRTRYFVAVEGQSEQAFVRWLQTLSENRLNIHLDAVTLEGGGFKSMLNKAARRLERGLRNGRYKARFLIIDGDRAEQGDWSVAALRQQAAEHRIEVVVQNPNHESLLFRMLPAMEREIPDAASAESKSKSQWPNYQKPATARDLGRQFALDDLLRVARVDSDLGNFLKKIGLMRDP
jgi:hypothetical protein